MPRRGRGSSSSQGQPYGTEMNGQVRTGPAQGYQNAVEPTHNGNFAWNGQPIPNFKPFGQGGQGTGISPQQSSQTAGAGGASGWTQQSGQTAGTGGASGWAQQSGQTAGAGGASGWAQQSGQAAGAGGASGWTQPSGQAAGAGGASGWTQQSSRPAGAGGASGWAQPSGQTAGAGGVSGWTQQSGQTAGAGGAAGWTQQSGQTAGTVAPTQAFMPQARDNGGRTFQGGMPVPGSSGNPNAEYGSRNTGINNADARNVGFQGGYTGYGPNGQPIQYGTFMRDGTQYGKGPHTIDPNKAIIQAVHYEDGGISAVKFQDGSTADIATAIGMAEAGLIEDVNTGKNREGQKTLRSYPDGDPSNNLSNLPRF